MSNASTASTLPAPDLDPAETPYWLRLANAETMARDAIAELRAQRARWVRVATAGEGWEREATEAITAIDKVVQP